MKLRSTEDSCSLVYIEQVSIVNEYQPIAVDVPVVLKHLLLVVVGWLLEIKHEGICKLPLLLVLSIYGRPQKKVNVSSS